MAVSVTDKVSRIYTRKNGCYIRLENPDHVPKEGYFFLPSDTPNYNSLYSLAVVAAINRYPLLIRTVRDITSSEHAAVEYLVLDW
ncbi:MAG: hypothetical protein GY855_01395 [candidate division Zixibacteria bacterium]|nr:hypothetical protein [candidate division Zixibacteria bacterium]